MIEYHQLTTKQCILYDHIMATLPEKPANADERPFIKACEELIHGVAGSGKTTLVALLIRDLQNRGYRIFVVAPTHKAAQQLKKAYTSGNVKHIKEPTVMAEVLASGSIQMPAFIGTVHSALGIKITHEEDQQKLETTGYPKTSSRNRWNKKLEYHCDIMMCDEGSMVSGTLLGMMRSRQREEMFHLIHIGDRYQLEAPDGDGGVSPVFSIPTPTVIDEVTRQAAGSPITQLSVACREKIDYYEGRRPDNPPFSFSSWVNGESIQLIKMHSVIDKYLELIDHNVENTEFFRILSFTNDRVDDFNRVIRRRLYGNNVAAYVVGEIVVLQDPTPGLVFSNNEEVRITEIEPIDEIITAPKEFDENGDIIREIEFTVSGYRVTLESLDTECNTETIVLFDRTSRDLYNEWIGKLSRFYSKLKSSVSVKASTTAWREFWVIKNKYPEVKPCYASTVHKAQGSTLSSVIFDLETTKPYLKFKPTTAWRLIYVASTRPEQTVYFAVS